uniref:Uncharacterized protein n=1 Tax=Candidatus Nitrotoga fabula TaxID=2182327 RepID=A0A2X0SJU3_9PROT|nr:protein of unknown function [Candidatus Nitrotoga fabula]
MALAHQAQGERVLYSSRFPTVLISRLFIQSSLCISLNQTQNETNRVNARKTTYSEHAMQMHDTVPFAIVPSFSMPHYLSLLSMAAIHLSCKIFTKLRKSYT